SAQQSQDAFGGQNYRVRLQIGVAANQEPGDASIEAIDILVENVLTVPARALVALIEGGYAVELVKPDGTTTYTAVEVGEFADGWVEVTGAVTEGDKVVVPE
ncbi:MAG: efflux RND transporter periplasmic adaptor subunit, partial [Acidimicrobiia bacterium]|nr:efflux RND transporter periplasmic adaptor subunit [Acidimicrobiia bacterium]